LQVITLEFLSFHTEQCCDIVYVYDGSNSSAALVGRFSGHNVPGDIVSDSSLFIYFRSDGSMTTNGFKIRYTISDNSPGKEYLVQFHYMMYASYRDDKVSHAERRFSCAIEIMSHSLC